MAGGFLLQFLPETVSQFILPEYSLDTGEVLNRRKVCQRLQVEIKHISMGIRMGRDRPELLRALMSGQHERAQRSSMTTMGGRGEGKEAGMGDTLPSYHEACEG